MAELRERARSGWWRQPLGTGVIGLALAVAGLMVMSYTPAGPGDGLLNDLRRWAAEQAREEGAAGLKERLPGREAPYRVPGQLMLYAGAVLCVVAGVRMWRHSPEAEGGRLASEEDEDEVDEDGTHPG